MRQDVRPLDRSVRSASLVRPTGYSGFVSELMVFVASFHQRGLLSQLPIVMAGLRGGGVISDADFYLLSMLREILSFGQGEPRAGGPQHPAWWMPEPAKDLT